MTGDGEGAGTRGGCQLGCVLLDFAPPFGVCTQECVCTTPSSAVHCAHEGTGL